MKAIACSLTLLLTTLLSASDFKVEVGQTFEATIEALGKPMGTIELREKTLLLYPQGEVTLRNDRVTEIDLMSEEEFKADQERLRIEREEWLLQQERQAAARTEEGEAIKADKMKSRTFTALPAKDRVEYWRNFQLRYPEVDASEEIARALEGYEIELAELRSQQRIAELETRVALAEKEAATARLEAQKARDEAETRSRYNNYGLRYYSTPFLSNRYYYRPPTITIYKDDHTRRDDRKYHRQSPSKQHPESTAERVSRILNEKSN
jgi:hypothetical protein